MTEIAVADVRKNLSDAVNRVAYGKERLILKRRGKGVAALVPIEDLEAIEAMEDKIDVALARKALKEKGKPVPLETLKKQLGL
ncbi:MAG: type II toxin-antitoxin system Phd/YefM family antitoxin [Planctomycetota bacterium]|nr:type II toxin-antitoxin system Phd/YefM family antitoxin [Planctomycetota bacterium]